ncbi:condensation domain-containing protein [Streptomyces sp. 24-1644]|uniref:condensation domain-containing protein n=1 Tax=Streptomyces sp. 24-1644 TaxID=3457315 RepID=UPI003FA69A32
MTTSDTIEQPQDGAAPPLSFHQEFLCMFDSGNEGVDVGPFGPMYHIVGAWRLTGEVDEETLREALHDVVVRHEALRTSLVREGGTHRPVVLPAGPAQLEVRDLGAVEESERARRGEELLNEVESTGLSVRELPLLRAVLGRFDQKDSVLALIAHHTAADAWAMHVIARDLLTLYAARRGNPVPELPEATQHAEFARWERTAAEAPRAAVSKDFWRTRLEGARITGLRTDMPRSAGLPKGTAWQRFAVRGELADAVLEFSRAAKCSPFMTMFAAYQVLLHRRTGELDITVPTFSGGRNNSRFEDTVGSFINFLPLRTDLAGCASFRDVVLRTRTTCGQAFTHELPFAQLIPQVPELMATAASDDHQISVFQAVHAPASNGSEQAGDLTYSKIWERQLSQSEGSDIPDGVLWSIHVDPSGSMAGSLGYNTNRFKEETMAAFLADYLDLLEKSVAQPDAPLNP